MPFNFTLPFVRQNLPRDSLSNASLVNSSQEEKEKEKITMTGAALRFVCVCDRNCPATATSGSCIERLVLPRVAGVSPQDVFCYATTHTVSPGGNVRTRGAGGSLSVNPTLRAQQIAEVRFASYGISSWKQISTACHQGSSDRREAYSPKEERQEEGHPT